MDVPRELTDLTNAHYDALEVLLSDQSKGVIVARVAMVDFLVEESLVYFFCESSRQDNFADLILRRLTLDAKVNALSKLSLSGAAAEIRDNIVAAVRPIQRLRNIAAHKVNMKRKELLELLANPEHSKLLANFPQGFEMAAAEIQAWLNQLVQHEGFCVDQELAKMVRRGQQP